MEFMLWRGDKQILKYKYECEDDEKNNLHCTQDGVVRMNEERMVRDIFVNDKRREKTHPSPKDIPSCIQMNHMTGRIKQERESSTYAGG